MNVAEAVRLSFGKPDEDESLTTSDTIFETTISTRFKQPYFKC